MNSSNNINGVRRTLRKTRRPARFSRSTRHFPHESEAQTPSSRRQQKIRRVMKGNERESTKNVLADDVEKDDDEWVPDRFQYQRKDVEVQEDEYAQNDRDKEQEQQRGNEEEIVSQSDLEDEEEEDPEQEPVLDTISDQDIEYPPLQTNEAHLPYSARGVPRQSHQRTPSTFQGEHYNGPTEILLPKGRILRSSAHLARLVVTYDIKTAMKCPCEDDSCRRLVNIGKWGVMGCGSTVCVHCGAKRKGDWEGVGYGFMGKEDFMRHLNTAQCKASRGIIPQKRILREILGEGTYYKINNPQYVIQKRNGLGEQKKFYKCYVCHKLMGYRSRHFHHYNANHIRDEFIGRSRDSSRG